MLTVVKCLKIHSLFFSVIPIFPFSLISTSLSLFTFESSYTFLLFISSSFSHVLFPFHSFLLVILNCATSTLPNYVPPTERKKCTHTYPLTKSLYPIPLNYLVFSLFLFTVIPHILCSSTPA